MNNYLLTAAAVAAAAVVYTAVGFVSSKKLCLRKADVHSEKMKNNEVRILHISDLHNCRFGDNQSGLVNLANVTKPQIIFLTGDIVEDTEELKAGGEGTILTPDHPARQLIENITKIAPVYMVFGNHEANIRRREELKSELEALSVRLVGGKKEKISLGNTDLLICGMDDPRCLNYRDENSPEVRFAELRAHKNPRDSFVSSLMRRIRDDRKRTSGRIDAWRNIQRETFSDIKEREELTLLLSHRPEEQDFYNSFGFDIAFSGHAHGGQFRISPFFNGLYAPHQGIFPKTAGGFYVIPKCHENTKSEKRKVFQKNCDIRMVSSFFHSVSRGLAVERFPRFYNPPEVSLITIIGAGDCQNR